MKLDITTIVLHWDEKPANICGKCGYHKNSCVCSVQKPKLITLQHEKFTN